MTRTQHIQRVLWIILALNIVITIIKLGIGFATGALSVIADGFHSIIDSSSNIIGLAGLWIASRPPDENHPYGHRKYETVATLAIGAMLLLVSWEIVKGIFDRVVHGSTPSVETLDIVIMAGTFFFNWVIVWYETREGKRLGSDILLADATHTRTDLFVTISVVISLVATQFGFGWVDVIVASGVVLFIVKAAFEILRQTSYTLTDASVIDPKRIEQSALAVNGVKFAHRVRSRGSVGDTYVDLHISVDHAMSTDQAHAIATEVESKIKSDVAGVVDAVVHIEPARERISDWEAIMVRARAEADALGISVHDIHAHLEMNGDYAIEMHVEVPAQLSLGEAHAIADELEKRICKAIPRVSDVTTHLEPLEPDVPNEEGESEEELNLLTQRIAQTADSVAGAGAAHAIHLHRVEGHLTVTVHVTQPASSSLAYAHELAEEINRRILNQIPEIERVVVHVEPPE
ncbi:MAG: cation diffusion facilitator family transporter [Chloroflexi bacterium]|nr:cation diffusion facilitator family transporter [Chloroflexota bacterium]